MESLEEQYSTIGKGLSEERKEVSKKEEEYQKLKGELESVNGELQEKEIQKITLRLFIKIKKSIKYNLKREYIA